MITKSSKGCKKAEHNTRASKHSQHRVVPFQRRDCDLRLTPPEFIRLSAGYQHVYHECSAPRVVELYNLLASSEQTLITIQFDFLSVIQRTLQLDDFCGTRCVRSTFAHITAAYQFTSLLQLSPLVITTVIVITMTADPCLPCTET